MILILLLAAPLILAVLALIFRFNRNLFTTGRTLAIIALCISLPMTLLLEVGKLATATFILRILFALPLILSVIAILVFLRKPPEAGGRRFPVEDGGSPGN